MLWCWRVGWQAVCTVWSRLLASNLLHTVHTVKQPTPHSAHSQATYSTQCTQLASRLSNITTVTTGQITICSENAVWPPEDGLKDARNMLRNDWLTIKWLIVASSWALVDLQLHAFLMLTLDKACRWLHALRALHLRSVPVANCSGDWSTPRAGLDL
jgi:hypothetical protein